MSDEHSPSAPQLWRIATSDDAEGVARRVTSDDLLSMVKVHRTHVAKTGLLR